MSVEMVRAHDSIVRRALKKSDGREVKHTGDGLMAGLQFLAEMVRADRPASALMHQFDPVPQLLKNVRFSSDQRPLEVEAVKRAIAGAEAHLGSGGRLLIRKSGTESLVRVMAEHEDPVLMQEAVEGVVSAVEKAVAG